MCDTTTHKKAFGYLFTLKKLLWLHKWDIHASKWSGINPQIVWRLKPVKVTAFNVTCDTQHDQNEWLFTVTDIQVHAGQTSAILSEMVTDNHSWNYPLNQVVVLHITLKKTFTQTFKGHWFSILKITIVYNYNDNTISNRRTYVHITSPPALWFFELSSPTNVV